MRFFGNRTSSDDMVSNGPEHDTEDSGNFATTGEDQPAWMRDVIQEFDEHGLKPYRPSRFSDGVYLYEVVSELEDEHDVEIRFIGIDVREGDPWEVQVDGRTIGEVHRYRHQDGYSVFEIESAEFVAWVRDTIRDE